VYTDGDLLSYGSHLARNDFISCMGHFYSGEGGFVAEAEDLSSACGAIDQGHTYEQTLKAWSDTQYGIDMTTMWYSQGRPGNATIIKSMWFFLRTEVCYVSQGFELWQARWAQMYKENGGTPTAWTETSVTANRSYAGPDGSTGSSTYPFPGREPLTYNDRYYENTNKMWDGVNGYYQDRGPLYEAVVQTNAHTPDKIDGTYPIIGK
jgi:hypothetical protein